MAIDLNDLRVFGRVADLGGFSAAGKALAMPKSSVSRAVDRLERALAIRLVQRTTRQVALTEAGRVLHERSRHLVSGIEDAASFTATFAGAPRGTLVVSAGIGFGINVLGPTLPGFLARHPDVNVSIALESRSAELVAERIDVAIRMGPLPDSGLVATRLGDLTQYMCAARTYLERCGRPREPRDLSGHQVLTLRDEAGRPRAWHLARGAESVRIEPPARVEVNDVLTLRALMMNGAGITVLSAYLCGDAILSGEIERVLPDWSLPPVAVSMVFPSRRDVSPVVRAFVAHMREAASGAEWLADPLERPRRAPGAPQP